MQHAGTRIQSPAAFTPAPHFIGVSHALTIAMTRLIMTELKLRGPCRASRHPAIFCFLHFASYTLFVTFKRDGHPTLTAVVVPTHSAATSW